MKVVLLRLNEPELRQPPPAPEPLSRPRPRSLRVLLIVFAEFLIVLAGALAYSQWPRELTLPQLQPLRTVESDDRQIIISRPGLFLLGKLARFDDPLLAYLTFDYYRSREAFAGAQVMLTVDRKSQDDVYTILLRLPDDLIAGVTKLAQLQQVNLATSIEFNWVSSSELWRDLHFTNLFNHAFAGPPSQSLEQLSAPELQSYVSEFIRFKSSADPRTWHIGRFILAPVSASRADRLAEDIVSVADFYNIPVGLLLGIGAMENNFLDAPGDLDNAVWKRRAEPDDIVLQRKGRRAWILNSSTGIWQITRQSLRHAQQLFLADDRDYSRLPERLRPPKQLDLDNPDKTQLTTYAGLLLRESLDRFAGDVPMAVGAYNGTFEHPNLKYAEGVETVARYARRVIGCTADLNRLAAAEAAIVQTSNLGNASPGLPPSKPATPDSLRLQ